MFTVVVERAPRTMKLPPEVIAEFCRYFSRDDLRNFALSCKDARPHAHRALFHDIFVKIDLDSFDKLRCISEDETLSKYVRKLEYDGRVVSKDAFTYEDWFLDHAATGLGMDQCYSEEDKKSFLNSIPPERFQVYYQEYRRYVYGQDFLRKGKLTKHLLLSAFTKLPCLSSIVYTANETEIETTLSSDIHGVKRFFPVWTSLGTVAKRILQQPQGKELDLDDDPEDQDFKAFWEALSEASVLHKLHDLHLVGIDLRVCKKNSDSFLDIFQGDLNLSSIALEFRSLEVNNSHSPGQGLDITKNLACQTSIHTLELLGGETSCNWYWDERDITLSQLISPGHNWKFLRVLTLSSMKADYDNLTLLLRTHSLTLRHLKLGNITLTGSPPTPKQPKYWVDFFVFLNRHTKLDSFIIHDLLNSKINANDYWSVLERCGHKSCLKQKVIRYVLHQGRLPFRPGTGKENGEENDDFIWIQKVAGDDYCFER